MPRDWGIREKERPSLQVKKGRRTRLRENGPTVLKKKKGMRVQGKKKRKEGLLVTFTGGEGKSHPRISDQKKMGRPGFPGEGGAGREGRIVNRKKPVGGRRGGDEPAYQVMTIAKQRIEPDGRKA